MVGPAREGASMKLGVGLAQVKEAAKIGGAERARRPAQGRKGDFRTTTKIATGSDPAPPPRRSAVGSPTPRGKVPQSFLLPEANLWKQETNTERDPVFLTRPSIFDEIDDIETRSSPLPRPLPSLAENWMDLWGRRGGYGAESPRPAHFPLVNSFASLKPARQAS